MQIVIRIVGYADSYTCNCTCVPVDKYPLENTLLKRSCIRFWEQMDGMSEDNNTDYSLDIKRPLVIRALRRSNIRKKVAEYLFDISPSYSYTSEIAYNVGATSSNVIGALRGMNSRYKKEESLISLDVIEEKSGGKNIRLYGITPFGKEMMETIKNRR